MTNTPDDYSRSSGSGESGGVIAEQVKQGAQQAAQQGQQMAGQVVQGAQQKAQSTLSSRKDQMTESLCSVAQAMRQTGETLREQNQGPMAGIADTAAGRVESVAEYFQRRDVGQIINDTETYARGNPVVFLGGAFVLGVAAARFLKSSSPPAPRTSGYTPYRGYSGPYGSGYNSSVEYGERGTSPYSGTSGMQSFEPASGSYTSRTREADFASDEAMMTDGTTDLGGDDGTTRGSY